MTAPDTAVVSSKELEAQSIGDLNSDYGERYGFHDPDKSLFKAPKGLTRDLVAAISEYKNEPQWMLEYRLKAYEQFLAKGLPPWISPLAHDIDFDDIHYFVRSNDKPERSWDDVPEDIKNTFQKLGIPEAEQKYLAGVGAQYDSVSSYHHMQEELEAQGVIFTDMDTALQEHEELVKKYWGTVVPSNDNKFSALNSAVWSGGSFVFVPEGVHVSMPLQAYFRINTENMGQFERTLIIAEKGAKIHYSEGCSSPSYSSSSLHSAVVEIIAHEESNVQYTTVQNWMTDVDGGVFNMVTKRAYAHRKSVMTWLDANVGCLAEGSRITTDQGLKPIEDIEIGDRVLSYNEEEQKMVYEPVTAKKYSGLQPVHEVALGQRKILATSNHPFYSYRYDPTRADKLGRYNLDYVRTDELTHIIYPVEVPDAGEPYELYLPPKERAVEFPSSNQHGAQFTVRKTHYNTLTLPTETNEDLMWLFGAFVGDGNIQVQMGKSMKRWGKVSFSIPTNDRAHHKLMRIMNTLTDKKPTVRKDGVISSWNEIDLAEFFLENGFITGARKKRVPEWVHTLPKTQRLAFIAGYLDTDGTTRGGYFSIKSVNNPLLTDFSALLTQLGWTSRIWTAHDEPKEVIIMGNKSVANECHVLAFLQTQSKSDLAPYLSDGFNERIKSMNPMTNTPRKQIGRSKIVLPSCLEVSPIEVGELSETSVPTWDIEVAGTGNFVAEGFLVHNSTLTSKYPSIYLMGEGAHGEILSMAFASHPNQHQDAGGKIIHAAPNTTSNIMAKSISKNGGRSTYRGLLEVGKGATNSKSKVVCDALLLDEQSRTDTYPTIRIGNDEVDIGHEATVSKVGDEQIFYLMSHGLSEDEANKLIVNGFIEPIVKEFPMEYAVELTRLVELEMEGSIG